MSEVTLAPRVESAYVDTRPFWQGANIGRLILQRCGDTGRFQHVPRPVSIYTGSRNLEWAEASGRGIVAARTTVRTGHSRIDDSSPHVIATVRLAEGIVFLSELIGADRFDTPVGASVHVAWVTLQDGRAWPAFDTGLSAVSCS